MAAFFCGFILQQRGKLYITIKEDGEMIYLQNTTDKQTINIPVRVIVGSARLRIISTVDLREIYDDEVINSTGSNLYFNTIIQLRGGELSRSVQMRSTSEGGGSQTSANVADGEYQYILTTEEGEVIACGLMIIGDYEQDLKDYNKTIEYTQYERD